jgi:hypothetical protein
MFPRSCFCLSPPHHPHAAWCRIDLFELRHTIHAVNLGTKLGVMAETEQCEAVTNCGCGKGVCDLWPLWTALIYDHGAV